MVKRATKAHDRRAADLPLNAHVVAQEIEDPFGIAESATLQPASRPGGKAARGAPEWSAPGAAKILVVRSIRSDPLAWMQAHGRLSDAKYKAARQWQALHARSSIGRIQAIDTSKEPVDGGALPEMLTDAQAAAIRWLDAIDRKLDESKRHIIYDVLAVEMFIAQSAAQRGMTAQRAGREFHQALDLLAVEFGLASAPAPARRMRRPPRRTTH